LFSIMANPVLGQKKDCSLSADDLIQLVKANDKTVDNILLHHCFVLDKSVNNGAKANYSRDYKAYGNLNHDLLFTVTSGIVTFITTSASSYNLYKSELQKKGFKYAGEDEQGAGSKYVYDKYMLYASTNNDGKGVPNYIFMIDKE